MIEVKKQQSFNVKDALVLPLSGLLSAKLFTNFVIITSRYITVYRGIAMLKIRGYCGFTFFGIFPLQRRLELLTSPANFANV